MGQTASIAKNTAIQALGKGLGMVATVATVALMTRTLGAEGFGYYAAALAFLQVSFILVDFGLQMTTVTLISDPRQDARVVFGNVIGFRIVTAMAVGVLSGFGVFLTNFPPAVKSAVGLLGLSFIAADLTAVLTGVFQKHLAMARAAVAEVSGKLLTLVVVTLAAAAGWGLSAMVAATVAGAVLQALLLYLLAQRLLPFRPRWDLTVWKKIVQTTWPLAVTISFNLVYFKMDTVILAATRSPQEVGLYGAPYRVLELGINLGYLFLGLLLPILASAHAVSDRARFTQILQRGFDAMAAAAWPMLLGGVILAQPLMVLVAGPEFAASGPLLSILLLATAVILLAAVFGYGIVALGRQRQLIFVYVGNAILALVAYGLLIPRYGATAAAWLTVASELVILGANLWYTARWLHFLPRLTVFTKAAVSAALMAGILWLLPNIPVVLRGAIGGAVYLAIFSILGGLPHGILRQLMKHET